MFVEIPQLINLESEKTMVMVLYSKQGVLNINNSMLREVFGEHFSKMSQMDIRTNQILIQRTISGKKISWPNPSCYGPNFALTQTDSLECLSIMFLPKDLVDNNAVKFIGHGPEKVVFDLTKINFTSETNYEIK